MNLAIVYGFCCLLCNKKNTIAAFKANKMTTSVISKISINYIYGVFAKLQILI